MADPQPSPPTRVVIDRLGARGEGIVRDRRRLAVPYALPGETVAVQAAGERATLIGVVTPSRDRIDAICPYFASCGGCAVQTLAAPAYARWKRDLLVAALARVGVKAEVAPLVDAHGAGRRRATFHARTDPSEGTRVGFMRARAHEIVEIAACPILDPSLDGALAAARAIAEASPGKPLDILVTGTQSGLDVDLRGHGPLDEPARKRLVGVALEHDLARLSNHGVIVLENRRPTIVVGEARVEPPPGAFLQATELGERTLGGYVSTALAGATRIADLFAGLGTFALRLASTSQVSAFDTEAASLAALDQGARASRSLRPIAVEARDLFGRPLGGDALDRFDALVMDPPRAGAEAQARAIAASKVQRLVSVSCNVDSFARDAAILVGAGFSLSTIVPVDQFRYSPHLEIMATFQRKPPRRARRLLG